MTNNAAHSHPPPMTALFVTVTNKGPIESHPEGLSVLKTDRRLSVMANCEDPSGVIALLGQYQRTMSVGSADEEKRTPSPRALFLKSPAEQDTPGPGNKATSKGKTLMT